jgi:hypothetical protein
MVKITCLYAIALIVLGVGGYAVSDGASVTALIPAFFGVVFFVLASLARKEPLRKHMMHVASFLAVVAVVGTATGLGGLLTLLQGGDVERPLAAISRSVMALLSLVYFGFCIQSFVRARWARKKGG